MTKRHYSAAEREEMGAFEMKKVILVGRHAATDMDGIDVIEQRAVQFPATAAGCSTVLHQLIEEAREAGAGLLFQAVPGQLAVALAHYAAAVARGDHPCTKIGVIVSRPGARESGVERQFHTETSDAALTVENAVKFANPNARTTVTPGYLPVVTVTVDPPMRFEFSHIEWL